MAQRKPTAKSHHKAKKVIKPILVNGRIFEAGSPVPEDLTPEQVERLVRLGHIGHIG